MSPVPPAPRARREQELLERGEPIELVVEGHQVRGSAWGSGAPVVVQHGWSARGTAMWALIKVLEPHFRVMAVDAPGHGDSEGTRSTMFLFAHTLGQLSKQFGPLHAIVAHSIGATALPQSTVYGASAERYVSIAARNELGDLLTRFFEISGLDPSLKEGVHQHWADEFGWDCVVAATPSLLAPGISKPALIIHDEDDEEIDVSEAHTIHAAWPGSELVITQGLGHIRITRSAEVAERVRDFLLAQPLLV